MEKDKFDLFTSPRFWQLFFIGVCVGLNFPFPNNVWVQGLSAAVSVWFGGSVAVRTIDKITEIKPTVVATSTVTPVNKETVSTTVTSTPHS